MTISNMDDSNIKKYTTDSAKEEIVSKARKWVKIVESRRVQQICVAMICIHVIIHQIWGYEAPANGPIQFIWALIYLCSYVQIIFTINYEIMIYELKNRFSVYWRMLDAILAFTAIIYIDARFNSSEFDKKSNLTIFESVFIAMTQGFVFITTAVAVTMAKGFVAVPNKIRVFLIVVYILVCFFTMLNYCLKNDDSRYNVNVLQIGNVILYTIDVRAYGIVKIFDALTWFSWDLWQTIKYPNQLRVHNINYRWTSTVPDFN